MKCKPVDFTIEIEQSELRFHLNEAGKLKFYITNKFDCLMEVNVDFEFTETSLDRIEGWEELKVIPNKRDSFTLPLLWSDVANC